MVATKWHYWSDSGRVAVRKHAFREGPGLSGGISLIVTAKTHVGLAKNSPFRAASRAVGRSEASRDFSTYPWPKHRACSMNSASLRSEQNTILVGLSVCCNFLATSKPSMTGMETSRTAICGHSFSIAVNASPPSLASPTTVYKGDSKPAKAFNICGLSSAIRTVIFMSRTARPTMHRCQQSRT